MLQFVLVLHSLVRWVVLLALLFALFRAYRGRFGGREWEPVDGRALLIFTISVDVQMLLGIVLLLLKGFANLGSFWMDHIIPMVVAVVFTHIASAQAKKDLAAEVKFRKVALWLTLAVVVILVSIPWTRPLLPL